VEQARAAIDQLKETRSLDALEDIARNPKTPLEIALLAVESLGELAAIRHLERLSRPVPSHVSERAGELLGEGPGDVLNICNNFTVAGTWVIVV